MLRASSIEELHALADEHGAQSMARIRVAAPAARCRLARHVPAARDNPSPTRSAGRRSKSPPGKRTDGMHLRV